MMRNVVALSVFLVVLLGWISVQSSAQDASTSTIVLNVQPSTTQGDASLSGIVFDLVAVELEWTGFTVRSSARAGDVEGYHVVNVGYATDDREMQFSFTWTDATGALVYAEIERSVDLSLGMDLVIANAIRQLAAKAGVRALQPAQASPTGETTEPASADTADGSESSGGAPAAGTRQPGSGPPDASNRTDPTVSPGTAEGEDRGRFVMDAGGGAFLTVGSSTRYFAIAPGSSVFLGYRIRSGWLTFGIAANAVRFVAEGFVLTSAGYVGGLGPGIRLAVGRGAGPYLELTGGPAVLALDNERTGFIYGMMPFAAGGVGLPVGMGRSVGLTAAVDFVAYFTGSVVLMGITPSIELSVRL